MSAIEESKKYLRKKTVPITYLYYIREQIYINQKCYYIHETYNNEYLVPIKIVDINDKQHMVHCITLNDNQYIDVYLVRLCLPYHSIKNIRNSNNNDNNNSNDNDNKIDQPIKKRKLNDGSAMDIKDDNGTETESETDTIMDPNHNTYYPCEIMLSGVHPYFRQYGLVRWFCKDSNKFLVGMIMDIDEIKDEVLIRETAPDGKQLKTFKMVTSWDKFTNELQGSLVGSKHVLVNQRVLFWFYKPGSSQLSKETVAGLDYGDPDQNYYKRTNKLWMPSSNVMDFKVNEIPYFLTFISRGYKGNRVKGFKGNKGKYDVCIIGAGMSGLSCAFGLKPNDHSFIILEAQDYVGGRLKNYKFPHKSIKNHKTGKIYDMNEQYVEQGAAFLSGYSDNNRFWNYFKEKNKYYCADWGGYNNGWWNENSFIDPELKTFIDADLINQMKSYCNNIKTYSCLYIRAYNDIELYKAFTYIKQRCQGILYDKVLKTNAKHIKYFERMLNKYSILASNWVGPQGLWQQQAQHTLSEFNMYDVLLILKSFNITENLYISMIEEYLERSKSNINPNKKYDQMKDNNGDVMLQFCDYNDNIYFNQNLLRIIDIIDDDNPIKLITETLKCTTSDGKLFFKFIKELNESNCLWYHLYMFKQSVLRDSNFDMNYTNNNNNENNWTKTLNIHQQNFITKFEDDLTKAEESFESIKATLHKKRTSYNRKKKTKKGSRRQVGNKNNKDIVDDNYLNEKCRWDQNDFAPGLMFSDDGPEDGDGLVTNGYSQILDIFDEDIKKGVLTKHEVTSITVDKKAKEVPGYHCKVEGRMVGDSGLKFIVHAKYVVCSVSLGVLKHSIKDFSESHYENHVIPRGIKFDPPLPLHKQKAIESIGMGIENKLYIRFTHIFWDNSKPYFQSIYREQYRFVNYSYPNFKLKPNTNILCTMIPPTLNENKTKSTPLHDLGFVWDVLKCLYQMFGSKDFNPNMNKNDDNIKDIQRYTVINDLTDLINIVVDYKVTDWKHNPFTLGSYSYLKKGSVQDDSVLLSKYDPGSYIHFVGEAASVDGFQCLDGAHESGFKTSKLLHLQLTGKLPETKKKTGKKKSKQKKTNKKSKKMKREMSSDDDDDKYDDESTESVHFGNDYDINMDDMDNDNSNIQIKTENTQNMDVDNNYLNDVLVVNCLDSSDNDDIKKQN